MNTASAGPHSPVASSTDALGENKANPISVDGKKTGMSLVWMVSLGLFAASLAITGWLALLTYVGIVLVQKGVIDWVFALWIVALLNLAGAGGIAYMVIQRNRYFRFPVTRREPRWLRARGNQEQ